MSQKCHFPNVSLNILPDIRGNQWYIDANTTSTGETGQLQEIIFEGYGPGGVAILVETMTDNRNRTVSDVRHAFSKFGGNLGTDGSVAYLFKKLGLIHVAKEFSEEKLMEIVIESGAIDFTDEEDFFEVTAEANDFNKIIDIFKENQINYEQNYVRLF